MLSLGKSVFRIVGCSLLPFSLPAAAALLVEAEILGIVEELV